MIVTSLTLLPRSTWSGLGSSRSFPRIRRHTTPRDAARRLESTVRLGRPPQLGISGPSFPPLHRIVIASAYADLLADAEEDRPLGICPAEQWSVNAIYAARAAWAGPRDSGAAPCHSGAARLRRVACPPLCLKSALRRPLPHWAARYGATGLGSATRWCFPGSRASAARRLRRRLQSTGPADATAFVPRDMLFSLQYVALLQRHRRAGPRIPGSMASGRSAAAVRVRPGLPELHRPAAAGWARAYYAGNLPRCVRSRSRSIRTSAGGRPSAIPPAPSGALLAGCRRPVLPALARSGQEQDRRAGERQQVLAERALEQARDDQGPAQTPAAAMIVPSPKAVEVWPSRARTAGPARRPPSGARRAPRTENSRTC